MLKTDTLKTALPGLTDEQYNTIATMSENDEKQVIGAKVGEIHGAYEKDILEISGMPKNDGEKSYDYMKRVMGDYKSKMADPKDAEKLKAAEAQVASLKKQLEAGAADEAVKKQLADAKQQLATLQEQYKAEQEGRKADKDKWESELKETKIANAFDKATSGLKFKDTIPQELRGTLLAQAKAEVLAKGTPEFDEKGNLVIRGANNQLLLDPNNAMNPYTLEALVKETSIKSVLDTERNLGGGGTGDPNGGGGQGDKTILDLSGCSTRMDVLDRIDKHIMAQGITVDDPKFQEMREKLCADNKFLSYKM